MSVVTMLVKRVSIPILTAIAAVGLAVSPAFAGGPIVYRQAGNHYTPSYYAPTNATNIEYWLKPGERFNMICYTDFKWYTGNYYSNRWYWGQSFDHGYTWVHSSYVYYQWRVGRC